MKAALVEERVLGAFDYRYRPTYVGFVAAAVSKPMGGCRARRSLAVDVDVAAELAVL